MDIYLVSAWSARLKLLNQSFKGLWNSLSLLITFITYLCLERTFMNSNKKMIVKFHGTGVGNVIILYAIRPFAKPITEIIEEFDALKVRETCETINVQVVSDFVTITLYKQESTNSIIRRELIPYTLSSTFG